MLPKFALLYYYIGFKMGLFFTQANQAMLVQYMNCVGRL